MELALDALLPQRERLLDVELMADRFGTSDCQVARVNYKPAKSLRVAYLVNQSCIVGCRAYPVTKQRSYLDAELNAVFWTLPHDRRLAQLPAVCKQWPSSRVVAYAPEKSATLASAKGYVKVTTAHDAARQWFAHRALTQELDRDAHVRLPKLLDFDERLHTLLFETVPGESLAERGPTRRARDLELFGATLAGLHSLPIREAPRFARFDAARLHGAARDIGLVQPQHARLAKDVCKRLIASACHDGASTWLHGDVHLKNAIVCDDRITLLDFEDVAIGSPAADLAGLLAELRYERHIGVLDEHEACASATAFLTGYASVRRLPDSAVLAWHIAAALLVERALGAVNRVRREGLRHMGALLDEALELLQP